MKKHSLINKIISFLPILLVVVLSVFVAVSTYRPGTILSGWDTLHPEFNLKLYTYRVFWGAWQDHQGLGAAAAQAHLAELPRIPVLWLLKGLFGINLVRYIFILSMYVFGGISAYWYIKYVWFEDKLEKEKDQSGFWGREQSSIAAALGALFYLFNLGTLQQFQVPLEMFAVHFATFGLVLGSLHLFIKRGKKKFALFLIISQILAAPSAHTATLFYVYTGLVIGFGLVLSLINKTKTGTYLKRLLVVFLLILSTNLFWMGSNLFYIFNHSGETQESKINRNFSDEAFWQNQAFGEVKDVLIVKNFLFNWDIYDFEKEESVEMFGEWSDHLSKVETTWPYILGAIFISGIYFSIRSDRKNKLPLLLIFSSGFIFLNNLNFPSSIIYKILISLSDTIKEALRFPFTKFSIVFVFAASIYLAEFSNTLIEKISKIKILSKTTTGQQLKSLIILIVTGAIAFGTIYPMKPLLEGKLISEKVKVQIPNKYFELFEWFNQQPHNQRVAMLPILDFWQWNYFNWSSEKYTNGYQGGGFLWFGLPQPLLNREFDRWAIQNEYFYHEMNHALEMSDSDQLLKVLEKYDVRWIIFDKNIIDLPEKDKNFEKHYQNFLKLVSENTAINVKNTFENIEVYYVLSENPQELAVSGNNQEKVVKDLAYDNLGHHVTDPSFNNNFIFSNIFNETLPNIVEKNEEMWGVKTKIVGYDQLVFPNWNDTKSPIPVKITGQIISGEVVLGIESFLPQLEISESEFNIADFANSKTIQVRETLNLDDDYFHTNIGKEISVLDPEIQEEQFLGITYITPDQNLDVRISTLYNENTQNIIVSKDKLKNLFPKEKELKLNGGEGIVSLFYEEEVLKDLVKEINLSQTYVEENCTKDGEVSSVVNNNVITFIAKDGGDNCHGYLLNNLPSVDGYFINLETQNVSGPNFYFRINELGKKSFFQETIETESQNKSFAFFPKNDNDLSVLIHNRSFGSFPTENKLISAEIMPVPFNYIGNIVAKKSSGLNQKPDKFNIVAELNQNNTDFWIVNNESADAGLIILKQSYDDGWKAISMSRPWSKLPHYKYNSWGNAWEINNNDQKILVFFWPQILTWIGLILLPAIIILIIRYNFKNKKESKQAKPRFNLEKIKSVFYEEN